MGNLFEKMQNAKLSILESNLKKSGKNKFAGYTYYELADIIPTIVKVCNDLKLFTQISFTNEVATLKIINAEKPEEMIEYTSPMKDLELKGANAIQALGGVETYQRRYLYMAAFDIIENDMFDGDGASEKTTPKKETKEPTPQLISHATIRNIEIMANGFAKLKGKDVQEVYNALQEKFGYIDIKKLTEKDGQTLVNMLANWNRQASAETTR